MRNGRSKIIFYGIMEKLKPQYNLTMFKKYEFHLFTICEEVKLQGLEGKIYPFDCANTEGVKLSL